MYVTLFYLAATEISDNRHSFDSNFQTAVIFSSNVRIKQTTYSWKSFISVLQQHKVSIKTQKNMKLKSSGLFDGNRWLWNSL